LNDNQLPTQRGEGEGANEKMQHQKRNTVLRREGKLGPGEKQIGRRSEVGTAKKINQGSRVTDDGHGS